MHNQYKQICQYADIIMHTWPVWWRPLPPFESKSLEFWFKKGTVSLKTRFLKKFKMVTSSYKKNSYTWRGFLISVGKTCYHGDNKYNNDDTCNSSKSDTKNIIKTFLY